MRKFEEIPLILYDGECGLCNSSVQWITQNSTTGTFFFTPLQGNTAKNLANLPQDLDSVVVYYKGEYFTESSAAIFISVRLKGFAQWLSIFKFIPKPIRDWGYRLIAKNRIKWFGKAKACQLPDAELKKMFLN